MRSPELTPQELLEDYEAGIFTRIETVCRAITLLENAADTYEVWSQLEKWIQSDLWADLENWDGRPFQFMSSAGTWQVDCPKLYALKQRLAGERDADKK